MAGAWRWQIGASLACAVLSPLVGCTRTVVPIQITTTSLPSGWFQIAYHAVLESTEDEGTAVSWQVTSGTLPPGVTLALNGHLDGIPTEEGVYQFRVRAIGLGHSDSTDLVLDIGRKRWLFLNLWDTVARNLYAVDFSDPTLPMTLLARNDVAVTTLVPPFSPDARKLIYPVAGSKVELQVRDVSGKSLGPAQSIGPVDDLNVVAWSPDSKGIAYRAGKESNEVVYFVDLSHDTPAAPVRVGEAGGPLYMGWLDEHTLYWNSPASNWITARWDGAHFDPPHELPGVTYMIVAGISPDRRHVMVLDYTDAYYSRIIHLDDDSVESLPGTWGASPNGKFIFDSDGANSDVRTIVHPTVSLGKIAWGRNAFGTSSWFHATDRRIWPGMDGGFKITTLSDRGLDTVPIPGFAPSNGVVAQWGAVAFDDSWLATSSTDALYVSRLDGGDPTTLQKVSAPFLTPPPDGPPVGAMGFARGARKFIYFGDEDVPGFMDLYLVDLTGDAPMRVRISPAEGPPSRLLDVASWSADSSTIVFSTFTAQPQVGNLTVYLADMLHGNAVTQLTCKHPESCPSVTEWRFQP